MLKWLRVWAINVSLAAIWFWFAKIHLELWLNTGDPRGIGALAMETVVAVLFLTRRSPIETSLQPVAWAATIVGAIGPMFMRPTAFSGGGSAALLLQLAGASFSLVSLVVIGRSFGLVAANRGIVARGPYRLVRHPVYFGYFVTQLGYVFENPSQRNLTIFACATLAQLVRIRCEEQVLSHDPMYAAYRRRVRFRLIPYVY